MQSGCHAVTPSAPPPPHPQECITGESTELRNVPGVGWGEGKGGGLMDCTVNKLSWISNLCALIVHDAACSLGNFEECGCGRSLLNTGNNNGE